MPIGHGQIVGFERFGLDADALHRLYRPAFGQQPVARFQAVYLYPFSFRVKGMDAVGFDSMAAAQGIRNGQINSFGIGVGVLLENCFVAGLTAVRISGCLI